MTTQFILLGTGTPNYAPSFSQQSSAVLVNDQAYIIDAGDGVMVRIMEAFHAKKVTALHPQKLTRIFLTHLHPDHTSGLAGLLINPWVLERGAPVEVYGPKGTQALVDGLMAAFASGVALHRDGLAPLGDTPLVIQVTEYVAGEIYCDEQVTVEAFGVSHGVVEAYGLRFKTPDAVIVHSGDTCPQQSVIEHARGCDLLVHEVYFGGSLASRPAQWQTYHSTVHTSGTELGRMARVIRPKLLVLNHQLIWGEAGEAALIEEISVEYDGPIHYGRDLDVFAL